MTIIPAPQFKPDKPDLVDDGSQTVRNVIPRTEVSYGPMPSLVPYSVALTARVQGGIGVADTAGNTFCFVGDGTKLYKGSAGSAAFADVSAAGGYECDVQGRWSFTFWTPNLVLAADFDDAIQAFTIGTSSAFSNLSSGAPKAKYLAVIRDFVFAFNIFDAVDGLRPSRAHWCAIGAPDTWPVPGTNAAAAVQSDFQDINLGDFGQGMGIVGGLGTADGAAFFERGLVRINYVNPPDIFGFFAVEGARGTIAAGSIAQNGANVFFLGPDDLYVFDGTNGVGLGADTFALFLRDDIDQTHLDRISSCFDPINQIYFMAYPSANNNAGTPNKLLAYHWLLKRAAIIDAAGDIELIFKTLSFGETLEDLDNFASTLEALPFSLDSRAWTGGTPLLSAIDAKHRLGYFTGPSLPATVDTSEAQVIKGRRGFVNRVRPLVDAISATVSIGTRGRVMDAKVWGPPVPINELGECPIRSSARYHTARINVAAGDTWSQLFGVDVPDDAISDDGDR
jgi:hypothetical protein